MKLAKLSVATVAAVTLLTGCKTMDTTDLMGLGAQAFQVATFSDADARKMADGACQEFDARETIAPANSKYTQRLNKIAKNLGNNIDGVPLNYKVYMTDELNAWAMANGCIRVYSKLMDVMTDNELEGVLGHEIGHVALGHSKSRMKTAYMASLARTAAANSGNETLANLSNSEYGQLGEAFVNAQFSQSNETEADTFSFNYLTKRGIKREGLVTAFEKFAKMDGGEGSLLSSHPSSNDRVENMRTRLKEQKAGKR